MLNLGLKSLVGFYPVSKVLNFFTNRFPCRFGERILMTPNSFPSGYHSINSHMTEAFGPGFDPGLLRSDQALDARESFLIILH